MQKVPPYLLGLCIESAIKVVVIMLCRDNVENQAKEVREAKMGNQDRQVHLDSEENRDHRVRPDLKDHLDLVENLDHQDNLVTAVKMDNLDQMVREESKVRTKILMGE